jgi:hypothetical protein
MNEARRILILEDNADDVALLLRELKKQKISFTADAVSSRHAYEQALRTGSVLTSSSQIIQCRGSMA